MKFSLGPGESTQWHKWFAWFPVKVDVGTGKPYIAWLEHVERQLWCVRYGSYWHYRPTRENRKYWK